eukprot:TRINITY_DN6059_c0_g2_i1.p1 TRINITY_DN6059_c0_g2~~TRINITY_DN6059_c0_g2_i1.p1  ORF type:complete len:551 (+),score=124.71 TRINITY_DN6059_c0_g2_i1:24-1676(+)
MENSKYGLNPIQRSQMNTSGSNFASRIASMPREEQKDNLSSMSNRPSSRPGSRRSNNILPSTSQVIGEGGEGDFDVSLGVFNPRTDEKSLVATLKADILQIQDDINKIDLDRRIRNVATQPDILKKGHMSAFKKFLGANSDVNIRDAIDSRLAVCTDVGRLTNSLGVTNSDDGLRKIFKAILLFDLFVSKLTEYEIISFLKYDEVFQGLSRSSNAGASQLAAMNAGVHVGRFNITIANLERFFEIIGVASKLSKGESTTPTRAAVKLNGLQDLGDALFNLKIAGVDGDSSRRLGTELLGLLTNNGRGTETPKSKGEDASKYVQELRQLQATLEAQQKEKQDLVTERDSLKQRIQEFEKNVMSLQEEIAVLKAELSKNRENVIESPKVNQKKREDRSLITKDESELINRANYYSNIVDEIKNMFDERYARLEANSAKISYEIVSMKAQLEELRARNDFLEKEVKTKEREREQIVESFRLRGHNEDTFESVLKEEFSRMQRGYESKVKALQEEVANIKRERGRQIIDLQNTLAREKDGRELLLKKLSLYVKP